MSADEDWMERGQCRIEHAPVSIFFPKGNTGDITIAKKICSRCTVRSECLEFCLATGQQGIWGGTTEDDRSNRHRFPQRYAS